MSPGLLLRLDGRRAAHALARPRPGFWAGTALPAALLVLAAWLAGEGLRPDPRTGDGRFLLGVLAAGPIALQAYPVLFRPADDSLLRRLGIPPGALFQHRALRLLALSAGIVAVLLLPFLRAGEDVGPAAAVAGAGALTAWGTALYFLSRAADRVAAPRRRAGGPLVMALAWDRELAANAALVYAPVPPLLAGAFAARFAPSAGPGWAAALLLAGVLAALAARPFRRALPRFAPHAGEMAWVPPASVRGGALVTRRGLPGLLPRGAEVVLARDGLVAARRHRWAARLVPLVGVLGALALLRGGEDPLARRAIAVAGALTLVLLGGVVLALGRAERGRTRWIDRSVGLRAADRLVGRWAFSLSRALLLAVPVGAAWAVVAPSPAWPWGGAALAGSLAAAGLSLAAAGR